MAYANVNMPVVITTTRNTSFALDDYTRRMCIISAGESKLNIGEFKEVDNSTFSQILKSDEVGLKTRLNNFFSYSGNRPVVVLEVGTLADGFTTSCNTISSFLDSKILSVFNIVVPDELYYTQQPDKTYLATLNGTFTPSDAEQELPFVLTGLTASDISFEQADDIEFILKENKIFFKHKTALPSSVTAKAYATIGDVKTELGDVVFNNKQGEAVATNLSFNKTEAGKIDTAFIELLQSKGDLNTSVFFFLNMPKGELTDTSNFERFKGLKAIQLCYNNSKSKTQHEASIIVGITANSIFDISTNNPSSSLNYKQAAGYQSEQIPLSKKNELIQAGVTLIDNISNIVIVKNGRQMDGTAWEYYFNHATSNYRVENKLSTLLINGANNPVSALKFNQDGIDTAYNVLKSELVDQCNLGILTNFAESFDSATGVLNNEGEMYCPTFKEFATNNAEDYKEGVFSGISYFEQIGSFIRQIKINVNIGA